MAQAEEIVIVGGGVMGCAVAFELARHGLSPLVLERSVPGAEASTAAAGMLAPEIEADHEQSTLSLTRQSRELYVDWARVFSEEHGLDIGLRRCGALRVAYNEAERVALEQHAHRLSEHDGEAHCLSGNAARELEPAIHPEVIAALHCPREAQLDPQRLLRALSIAAAHAGARFRDGVTVRGLSVAQGKVMGVQLEGEELPAKHVIVAAGSWTGSIAGVSLPADLIQPVRGQIVVCDRRPPLLRHLLFGAGGYVATRTDGRMLCGSTHERVGFRRGVTVAGMRRILSLAERLAPALAECKVVDYWSNFRPGTPDNKPLIGPGAFDGLWFASGHFRNGILWAPRTAQLIRHCLLEGRLPAEARVVDPRRFLS